MCSIDGSYHVAHMLYTDVENRKPCRIRFALLQNQNKGQPRADKLNKNESGIFFSFTVNYCGSFFVFVGLIRKREYKIVGADFATVPSGM